MKYTVQGGDLFCSARKFQELDMVLEEGKKLKESLAGRLNEYNVSLKDSETKLEE